MSKLGLSTHSDVREKATRWAGGSTDCHITSHFAWHAESRSPSGYLPEKKKKKTPPPPRASSSTDNAAALFRGDDERRSGCSAVVNYLSVTHFDNNYQDTVTAEDVKIALIDEERSPFPDA